MLVSSPELSSSEKGEYLLSGSPPKWGSGYIDRQFRSPYFVLRAGHIMRLPCHNSRDPDRTVSRAQQWCVERATNPERSVNVHYLFRSYNLETCSGAYNRICGTNREQGVNSRERHIFKLLL